MPKTTSHPVPQRRCKTHLNTSASAGSRHQPLPCGGAYVCPALRASTTCACSRRAATILFWRGRHASTNRGKTASRPPPPGTHRASWARSQDAVLGSPTRYCLACWKPPCVDGTTAPAMHALKRSHNTNGSRLQTGAGCARAHALPTPSALIGSKQRTPLCPYSLAPSLRQTAVRGSTLLLACKLRLQRLASLHNTCQRYQAPPGRGLPLRQRVKPCWKALVRPCSVCSSRAAGAHRPLIHQCVCLNTAVHTQKHGIVHLAPLPPNPVVG